MKKKNIYLLAVLMVFFLCSTAWAKDKAKLGPCVKQCVHAYNPSLADSGADEFMVDDFRAKECVQLCKENLYQGECDSVADNCCHPDFLATDPDCQSEPPPDDTGGNDPPPDDPSGDDTPPDDPPNPGNGGLPPDPGEAGKATLEGIDSDGDGIRDDIQRYIALTYPDSAKTRAALRQATMALQIIILESPDEDSALNNTELEARASECIRYIHPKEGRKIDNTLMAEFLNTYERSKAYLEYNDKLGGHVFGTKDLDEYKTSCTFDSDAMGD